MSGTVRRAFELAPQCESMKELIRRLSDEDLPDIHGHLQGMTIRKELHRRLKKGRDGRARSDSHGNDPRGR